MDNGLEFVLDGNPTVSDLGILPTFVVGATDLEFTYTRRTDSKAGTVQIVQWSADLMNWNDIIVDPGDPDTVTVAIPLSNAVDGKLFGRLEVEQP